MEGTTLPGTVQIRVITDKADAERLSQDMKSFLESRHMQVIDLTPDFPDRYDKTRVKFHVVAIPGGEPSKEPVFNLDGHIIGSSEETPDESYWPKDIVVDPEHPGRLLDVTVKGHQVPGSSEG